ncbi:MAG TPA: metal-dependent hydrolase [Candidatus Saccharimonadales bacterium]|nr:metal-dependent hydrolase [Candidatus Saccharimonadales bacterium]
MTARTHDLVAFSSLAAVFASTTLIPISFSTAVLAVLANLIGGIAPDIDQPTAPLWRNLPVGKYVGKVFDKFLGGHRFLSHSLIGLALFGFIFHLLLTFFRPVMPHVNISYVWWAFMIGMATHLIMDSLTKEGVPWLLPIPYKFGFPPLKAWRITTGKKVENWLVFPLIVALDVFLALHFSKHLLYLIHYRIY